MKEIMEHLQKILSKKRYEHSLMVTETAVKLAIVYKVDIKKAEIAGMLHDCAKELHIDKIKELLKNDEEVRPEDFLQPEILHGFAGAIYARNVFGIEDIEVLNAIRYHTVGRAKMTMLDKIIFIADWVEPTRKCNKIDNLRKIVHTRIDDTILQSTHDQIEFLVEKGKMIHINTIEMRNEILRKKLMQVKK